VPSGKLFPTPGAPIVCLCRSVSLLQSPIRASGDPFVVVVCYLDAADTSLPMQLSWHPFSLLASVAIGVVVSRAEAFRCGSRFSQLVAVVVVWCGGTPVVLGHSCSLGCDSDLHWVSMPLCTSIGRCCCSSGLGVPVNPFVVIVELTIEEEDILSLLRSAVPR
jgi:hypothetical protein